jgi:hypothetical protein
MTGDRVGGWHTWVADAGRYRRPGLVIAWRQRPGEAGWRLSLVQGPGPKGGHAAPVGRSTGP